MLWSCSAVKQGLAAFPEQCSAEQEWEGTAFPIGAAPASSSLPAFYVQFAVQEVCVPALNSFHPAAPPAAPLICFV